MAGNFWWYSLPALVSLSIKGAIYLYAYWSRTHNYLTRLYLCTLVAFSVQNIAEIASFYLFLQHRVIPTFEVNVYYAALIAAYAFLFHLVLAIAFGPRNETVRKFSVAVYVYAIVLEALLFLTPWLIVGYTPMAYIVTRIPGSLYWSLEIYSIGISLSCMAILVYGMTRQVSSYRRSQIKLVLVGVLPINIVVVAVLVALRIGIRSFNAAFIMPIALTFFLAVTAYAIHQYRLFDIEFFLPWSKVRRRKTIFYDRIQKVIGEVARMPSAQRALQAISDLFRCQVALIGGPEPLVAVPNGFNTSYSLLTSLEGRPTHHSAHADRVQGSTNVREKEDDTSLRAALEKIDGIIVSDEVADRDPALHQLMRRYGVGAVVPFKLPRVVGRQWLVLGDQFNEHVYTPVDFRRAETLFHSLADCFLDDFLALRSQFAIAIQKNDTEWQKQVDDKEMKLRESENAVAYLKTELRELGEELIHLRSASLDASELHHSPAENENPDGYVYTSGHSRICATGIYLPEERISTRDLLCEVDSKNRFGVPYHWLDRVTGIKEKRVTPLGVLPSDMAVAAAREALDRARIVPTQIDVIVYVGLTRDYIEPASAHVVQAKLGAKNAIVFDISNACHGFMNGIHAVDALLGTGQVRCGMVVAGEQGSLFTRAAIEHMRKTTDRRKFVSLATNFTLGDAGAAVVLGPKLARDSGLVGMMLHSAGQHAKLCAAGRPITGGPLYTDMPKLFAEGTKIVEKMFREVMHHRLGWRVSELKRCFIHQIGAKSLFKFHHERLGIPYEIMPKTVEHFGNLITANIPLTIHQQSVNRELKAGDKVYISASGSGLSIGQAGVIWDTVD